MKELKFDQHAPIRIWASDIDNKTIEQIKNVASLPFIHRHVAVMPDAHLGKGSTIGTVIATDGAVLPAAVGVDIGCGMCAIRLPAKIDHLQHLPKLRASIERSIPTGRESNRNITDRVEATMRELGAPPSIDPKDKLFQRAIAQLGTLGGGNHFIEICFDKKNDLWILLHSGSRNIGKEMAERHIATAKDIAKKRMIELPDPDLAYFTEQMPEFRAYIDDMLWAQRFAKANRYEMCLRVIKDVSFHLRGDASLVETLPSYLRVDCHHNYCKKEFHYGKEIWLTRKGAVSARPNELGIIPGSMGTASFIVRGLGNPQSFYSCSHGAGRRLSRTEAKKRFNSADLAAQTAGIECRKDALVVDEIPGAYKDIRAVLDDQKDLIEPIHELKQVLCIKGD